MGTRSILGTAHDGGFTGRYAHWDGYPSAQGPLLIATYADLNCDWEAVVRYTVREGESGYWSSYAPPTVVAAEEQKPDTVPCTYCTDDPGYRTWPHGRVECNACVGSGNPVGQQRNSDKTSSWVSSDNDPLVNSTDDVGAEWAYLLDEKGITVLSFQRHAGGRAVGMFGSIGDGYWRRDTFVAWTDDTVDWNAVEELASGELIDAEVVADA